MENSVDCQRFKITGVSTNLDRTITHAEKESLGFLDFTVSLFKTEAEHRQQNELRKRLKVARLPKTHDLSGYDHTVENGLPKTRLNQLRELNWIDQGFNIMLIDDEVLATAPLDRILFHCELMNLCGKSYRLKNRKPIFET